MKKITFLISFILFALIINAQTTGMFTTNISWTNENGSQSRTIHVFVPSSYNASTDYSLLIGLHGQGDEPANHINGLVYLYVTKQNIGDLICVAPEINDPTSTDDDWDDNNDMNGMILAIKTKIHETYNTDLNSTYLQGYSIGGKTAFFQGMRDADEIRGMILNSPAINGLSDVNNTSSTICDKDYNYDNSDQVRVCFSSSPTAEQSISPGCGTGNESFYVVANAANDRLNTYGGNSLFVDNSRDCHCMDTLTANVGQCWDFVSQVISTTDPVANFTANNTNISTGQSVMFTDNSIEGGAAITNWAWTFIGGTPSSFNGVTPSAITYNTAGSYEVSLTVTNSYGSNTKTKTGYITVSPIGDMFTLDFELPNDYSQNFAPWTNLDVDGQATYGSSDCDFPGEESAFSFMAFNPSDASFSLASTHGGDRCGMAICPKDASASNNWLISDKVHIGTGASFNFWALTPKPGSWGNETFNVLVSTTTNDVSSFTAIASNVEAPTSWTQKTYSLASYNGQDIYVAIQHISADQFMFWVDDIEIVGATVETNIVENNNIKLYPNPTNSIITISNISNSTIEITDINGSILISEFVNSNNTSFDLSTYSKGTYIVRIINNNNVVIRKIIVK